MAWGGGIWFSGCSLDLCPCGDGDRARVWGVIQSVACRAVAEALGVDAADPPGACHPTRRSPDCVLAHGRLAGVKKRARREGRCLIFVDESGFYLLPGRVKSYAPRGQTPILRVCQRRDHLSVMSGITPGGQLYTLVRDEPLTGCQSVAFLKHLLRHVSNKLLVIWDGSPIHRSDTVKTFLAEGGAQHIHLEPLPPYAPDLNPDEGVWQPLKQVEMKNLCCADLNHLYREFNLAIMRLRNKPHLIRTFFAEAGLKI